MQDHFQRARCALAAAAAGAALCSAGAAHGQTLALYDSFVGTFIQPTRWYGVEAAQYGGTRTEGRRAIAGGQLRLESRGYSDPYGDSSYSFVRNSLYFANPGAITAMRTTVTPRAYVAGKCTTNSYATFTRARLFGVFFNAGDAIPGSMYNDVYAGVQVYRASNSTDPADLLRVSAHVGICTDDSCIGSTILAVQDMGTTTLNTPIELQVSWDAAGNRFRFQRDSDAMVDLAYSVADTKRPTNPSKRLEVGSNIPHCTSARPVGSFFADFDDVKTATNAALAIERVQPSRAYDDLAVDPLVGHVN